MDNKVRRWDLAESHKFLQKNTFISLMLAIFCLVMTLAGKINLFGVAEDGSKLEFQYFLGSLLFGVLFVVFAIYAFTGLTRSSKK